MYGAPEKERSVCMGQDRGPDVHACKLNKTDHDTGQCVDRNVEHCPVLSGRNSDEIS